MNMRMNEMKILFMFGCPNREATVTRLRYAAALAVDPAAKKQMMELSSELDNDFTTGTPDFLPNYLKFSQIRSILSNVCTKGRIYRKVHLLVMH